MTQRRKLLIGNEWVDAADTIAVRSPHTGEVVGEVAKAGPAEMERAVQSAVKGFEETRKLSSARRVALETATLAMGSRNAARLKQLSTWVRGRAQEPILEEDDLAALDLAIACLEHPDSTTDSLTKLDAVTSGKLRTPARDVCEHPTSH